MGKVSVRYGGIMFTRDPENKRRHLRVYYWPGRGDRNNGVKALHVEIHKAEVGPVPAGWHVHHKDGDPLNNDPSNLEAVTPADHAERHFAMEGKWYGFTDEAHMAEMQELAKAWHASPEGLAWHSENGKKSWEGRERQSGPACFGCGVEIQTFKPMMEGRRWCSTICRTRWADRTKAYFPLHTCPNCNEKFRAKKRAVYCSRSCAAVIRNKARAKNS